MEQRQKTKASYPPMKEKVEHALTKTVLLAMGLLGGTWSSYTQAVPVTAPLVGEIEKITVNDPNDHWSAGVIVAGGQNIVIPKNLLIDLPANRVTLQQLFLEAPSSCIVQHETGLAKGDTCNASGTGGIATISGTRLQNGNVIAGDVLIEKAAESLTGQITFINYSEGYFRVNGKVGDATTGVMVRLNDPDKRHTIQSGAGCAAGSVSVNCSADPRFTLDGDNYTNVYSTGYPICIPSTVSRPFVDFANNPVGATTAQAAADGTGDALCPTTNRPASNVSADSRRFAPLMVGDSITAEGNYEEIGGVRFLSAHSTMVSLALATSLAADQPDYFFLDEVEVDAPGFQNRRARSLIIGYSTLPPDILLWSIHYDAETNSPHEFPLATTAGCDAAAGPLTCTGQGFAANAGGNIFKIRHDVDFATPTKPRWDPCAHIKADGRFPAGICPNSTPGASNSNWEEQFAILSPIMHEIQARTGRKFADMTSGGPELLKTIDIIGADATNGQYLFPFGMGLGGISTPEMVEIDLNALQTPISFSGLPWNLDRRLSPGGCIDTTGDGIVDCEATAQPLDPFPFEGTTMDPRTLSTVPSGAFNDPNYTSSQLSNAQDRILSFVKLSAPRPGGNGIGVNADGNFTSSILDWTAHSAAHATDPASGPGSGDVSASPVLPQSQICSANSAFNSPPVVQNVTVTTIAGLIATNISVLGNVSDVNGDPITVSGVGPTDMGTSATTNQGGLAVLTANGTIDFTPVSAGFVGNDSFAFTVTDGHTFVNGMVTVTVNPVVVTHPVATLDNVPDAFEDSPIDIDVLANDLADNSQTGSSVLSIASVTSPTTQGGTVTIIGDANIDKNQKVRYTPKLNFNGSDTFDYVLADGRGGSATATVTVTVAAVNDAPKAVNDNLIVTLGTPATISVLDNDNDVDGDPLTVSLPTTTTAKGTLTTIGNTVVFTPNVTATPGTDQFTYYVSDGVLTSTATVNVTVNALAVDVVAFDPLTPPEFRIGKSEWRASGTGSVDGKTITLRLGTTATGAVIGTGSVTLGVWTVRVKGGIQPGGNTQVTAWSSGNGHVTSNFTTRP
jgi:hypothetical protein